MIEKNELTRDSSKEKRKNAGKDLDTANWHAQQASYEEQRIADLERKLGK